MFAVVNEEFAARETEQLEKNGNRARRDNGCYSDWQFDVTEMARTIFVDILDVLR